jgi:iron-sulfur cluster insertion protein
MQTHEHTASAPPATAADFGMTQSAADRINQLKTEEGKPELRFRVAVKGGGCSGFQYEFTLDDAALAETDTVVAKNGAELVIDDVSMGILRGSILDFTEDLSHAGFEIKNPNATAKCGCGNSFSVAL